MLAAGFHQRVHDVLPGIEEERSERPRRCPCSSAPEPPAGGDAHGVDSCAAIGKRSSPRSRARSSADRCRPSSARPSCFSVRCRTSISRGRCSRTPSAVPGARRAAARRRAVCRGARSGLLVRHRGRRPARRSSSSWRRRTGGFEADGRIVVGASRRRRARCAAARGEVSRRVGSAGVAREPRSRRTRLDSARPGVSRPCARRPRPRPSCARCSRRRRRRQQLRRCWSSCAATSGCPTADEWYAPPPPRARGAILAALESLARRASPHDDAPVPIAGAGGHGAPLDRGADVLAAHGHARDLMLLDAPAAAYADVDELRLVGLVESDWPERARRSIFYPASLLAQLGWPNETDRLAAARARFHDLLRLARTRVSVSTLHARRRCDRAGVAVPRRARRWRVCRSSGRRRRCRRAVFAPRSAGGGAPRGVRADGDAARVAGAARVALARRRRHVPRRRGRARRRRLRRQPRRAVPRVSVQVLRRARAQAGRGARRGVGVDAAGARTVSARGVREVLRRVAGARRRRDHDRRTSRDALAMFESVAEAHAGDAARSRTARSSAPTCSDRRPRPGSASARSPSRSSRAATVVERLLEHPLEGRVRVHDARPVRARVRLRAKADRIDLLDDGTLRVDRLQARAGAEAGAGAAAADLRRLRGAVARGPSRPLVDARRAGYVAFKEKNAFVALGTIDLAR